MPLAVSDVVVGLTIRYLPGRGGNVPVDGFHAGEKSTAGELHGIAIAALASIALGPVVGPEGPLIALGAGMAIALPRLIPRPMPEQSMVVIAAVGSFAAISTLLGSPIVGAFLLLVGVAGALPCRLIRLCAQSIRPLVERFVVPATIAVALVIAGLAMLYAEVSGNPVAIGIGAMTVSMLRLPMTSVLLTSLFLGSDGILVMPVVIVAVVVAHVTTIRLTPLPAD